jgi:UDP-glucose 4-epimerase
MELKGRSVMVTGGAGFIGSHLVDRLIEEEPDRIVVCSNYFLGSVDNLAEAKANFEDLRIVEMDISDFEALQSVVRKEGVEVIFNLAVIPLPTSLEKPEWTFEENAKMSTSVCRLVREGDIATLVQFSSSEAYGTAQYSPMDEGHPLNPETPYAASKAATDHLALSYGRTFGIDVSVVRPFNQYGPRQNWAKYAGIIPLTVRNIMTGQDITVFGDGMQTRDFLYVTDTAEAVVRIAKSEKTRGKVINVASGQETAMLDLLKMIAREMDYDKDFVYKEARPGDVRRHIADISLARELIDFEPSVPIEEGVKRTVAWYKENMKL